MKLQGHDWRRKQMANWPGVNDTQLYFWQCDRCRSLIKATESGGMPGRLHLVCAGLELPCEEAALLREVHNS